MRPSQLYLIAKFNIFNAQCFGGSLPPIALRINHARTRLGSFAVSRTRRTDCRITLSDRFDLPADEVDDTLIHEMIHYWLHHNRLTDPTPHGPNFLAKMNEINSLHGRHISVSARLTAEAKSTGVRPRHNFICISEFADGTRGITICGRGSIQRIHRAFLLSSAIKSHRWFYSADPWFSRYPLLRSPKAWPCPPDLPEHLLSPI